MRPKLLPNPVDKQLHPPTPFANVNVEPLLVDEQLADLTDETPPRPFVKRLGADVRQFAVTTRSINWIHGNRVRHFSGF